MQEGQRQFKKITFCRKLEDVLVIWKNFTSNENILGEIGRPISDFEEFYFQKRKIYPYRLPV